MAGTRQTIGSIKAGGFDGSFKKLYGAAAVENQRRRYAQAIEAFESFYGSHRDIALYSAPGRTEVGGNHTDHNHGLVMAAAVNLDILAVVAKNEDQVMRVRSYGFEGEDAVLLNSLEIDKSEFGRSSALLRGVAAGLVQRGGAVGGFDAYTTSDVLKGSGLSSSAAFEVCLGAILNGEYNAGRFAPAELAMVGQYAENVHFGKPSGLMDQMASAVGSAVTIDFADNENPVVKQVPLDLRAYGLDLVITDTGDDHADLTPDYAAIRQEMEACAATFGKQVLRQVPRAQFFAAIPALRQKLGDRAVLRGIHFYEECRRVPLLAEALEKGDIGHFLQLITEGGHSSFEYNQNAYSPSRPRQQGMALGLALSQQVLAGQGGAWRLQGGGFAGTIQAFVPKGRLQAYCSTLGAVFGPAACHVLSVRPVGCTAMLPG